MNISKKIGGVGIKNMKFQNQSLMMKWLWKFASAENSLWKEVISAKYGMRGNWITTEVSSPYRSSVWRSISDLWDLVLERSCCKAGNGRKVAFWKDRWCGQSKERQSTVSSYTARLQVNKPAVANVHQHERDQMGEIRKDQRGFEVLE
ncbi:hypothetical protein MTR67_011434 [Solanum verrucosum]|uniref:Uncharacterized protein n=1 Tax=Solanum verrucosum TaxID=315347 RepID=A0AAF0QDR3_SOLVR|nr:hypothetical protein MTR67_011434 [Solanum verrucosum]